MGLRVVSSFVPTIRMLAVIGSTIFKELLFKDILTNIKIASPSSVTIVFYTTFKTICDSLKTFVLGDIDVRATTL